MRPSFVAFLLFLSLILARAQGIRVIMKVSLPVHQQQQKHNKQHKEEESGVLKSNNNVGGEESRTVVGCKLKEEEECTGIINKKKRAHTNSNNPLSYIQEDYYQPRRHRPRHH
ncbi:hypothetical protein PIB30_062252 [Stylosanthes scabra]|uniref:Uncharacterized protein n=1 Tax=Stylosanthes scabra TaxID=79078 RepID=A0ABU6XL86_9FABA|nr:hypothetical protein [Stylosanthes scabra]